MIAKFRRWWCSEDGQATAEQAVLISFLIVTMVIGNQLITEYLMPALRAYLNLLAVCLAMPLG